MKTNIYKISKKGAEGIHAADSVEIGKDETCAYVVDIQVQDRNDATAELKKLGLSEEICRNITEPSEHIRFEYFGESWYGELAYFSPQTKQSNFAGIIIHKNIQALERVLHLPNHLFIIQIKNTWMCRI